MVVTCRLNVHTGGSGDVLQGTFCRLDDTLGILNVLVQNWQQAVVKLPSCMNRERKLY